MNRERSKCMAQIKVIYINQSSGTIENSFLDSLITKGEIIAYCGSTGWLGVKNELTCGINVEQSSMQYGRKGPETAGN
jgi:hypothetical protein